MSILSLFTDVRTGIAPVVVRHNAHHSGIKILGETWWPKIWFQKRLYALLDTSCLGPTSYVAFRKPGGRGNRPKVVLSGGSNEGNVARDARYGGWLKYRDIGGECE